ncbi:hypothetical protein DIPPA_20342 [Diplonema papillatum]|nr:hypothetical protein DIPPA_20342 [Diplonema papillatum]
MILRGIIATMVSMRSTVWIMGGVFAVSLFYAASLSAGVLDHPPPAAAAPRPDSAARFAVPVPTFVRPWFEAAGPPPPSAAEEIDREATGFRRLGAAQGGRRFQPGAGSPPERRRNGARDPRNGGQRAGGQRPPVEGSERAPETEGRRQSRLEARRDVGAGQKVSDQP